MLAPREIPAGDAIARWCALHCRVPDLGVDSLGEDGRHRLVVPAEAVHLCASDAGSSKAEADEESGLLSDSKLRRFPVTQIRHLDACLRLCRRCALARM